MERKGNPMTDRDPMEYSEHIKLHAIADKSQACGEFMDWLAEQGWTLCEYHSHKECARDKDGFGWDCGLSSNELVPIHVPLVKLLAMFFEIDQDRIEAEKRQMLAVLRGTDL